MQLENTCRQCQSHGPFYASLVKQGTFLCKACCLVAVHQCRRASAVHLLSYRWYNALRRRGGKCPTSKRLRERVAAILARCGSKSVLSPESDMNKLCIVNYFRAAELELEPWNCLVVTQKEAKSLSHFKSEAKMHQQFPMEIQTKMEHEAATRMSN